MTIPVQAETLFDEIERFIHDSRALLKEGAVVELAGLDDQVRALCETVLRLTQDDRVRHADRLQTLLADLKALGEEMVTQRDAVIEELRGVSRHKKANVAYRTSDAIDNYGNNDEE